MDLIILIPLIAVIIIARSIATVNFNDAFRFLLWAIFWLLHLWICESVYRISREWVYFRTASSSKPQHGYEFLHALLSFLGHVVGFHEFALTRIEIMLDQDRVLVDHLIRLIFRSDCCEWTNIDALRDFMPGPGLGQGTWHQLRGCNLLVVTEHVYYEATHTTLRFLLTHVDIHFQ